MCTSLCYLIIIHPYYHKHNLLLAGWNWFPWPCECACVCGCVHACVCVYCMWSLSSQYSVVCNVTLSPLFVVFDWMLNILQAYEQLSSLNGVSCWYLCNNWNMYTEASEDVELYHNDPSVWWFVQFISALGSFFSSVLPVFTEYL